MTSPKPPMNASEQRPSSASASKPQQESVILAAALDLAAAAEAGRGAPGDQEKAVNLFRKILRDGDEALRRQLSEAVKHSALLSHDLVLAFVSDQPSVALPFLAHSPLLTEADLVKLAWSGDAMKQVTIAARPDLPSAAASALAEVASQRVIQSLLANRRAALDEDSLVTCFQRFGDDPEIQEKLIDRPQLPLAVSDPLLELAAPELQQRLLSRHAVSPDSAREAQRRRGSWTRWWQAGIFAR